MRQIRIEQQACAACDGAGRAGRKRCPCCNGTGTRNVPAGYSQGDIDDVRHLIDAMASQAGARTEAP